MFHLIISFEIVKKSNPVPKTLVRVLTRQNAETMFRYLKAVLIKKIVKSCIILVVSVSRYV